jgi:hypothetical protein
LVKFNVSTTDACCVVVSVAKKVLAKHTTFDAIVDEVEHPVDVLAVPTVTEKLQVCPPKVIAKAAVPVDVGVPAMAYVRLPAPLANVPAAKVAVRPVTPVEEIAVPAE